MPLRLFRARTVTGANLVMVPLVAGMFSVFFLGALYLQRVLGYSPLEVGLAFLPNSVIMALISLRLTERLMTRFGARTVLVPGMVPIGIGLLLFARAPVDGTYLVDVLPASVCIGVGGGLTFPSLMSVSMAGIDVEDSGLASGVINSTIQVGGAVGLAVLATLSASRTGTLTDAGEPVVAALTGGYRLAFLVAAALVGVALIVALVVLGRGPSARVAQAPERELAAA